MIEKRISFKLDPGDIFIYDNTLLKTASVNLPDNIPYDPNFLYVEVRAVSAGEYYGNNKNIDYFPEGELNPPKKNAGYGKETFITAHVFKNHDNKDVANAIGDVLKVTWDDEMKGVNLLLRIDKLVSPSVARGFEAGYITDVSMGCRVHHVVCSICGHNARTKADYCNHLKTEKGKIYPDGKKVQEINIQPKFHDISVVLNGAEKIAKVMRIYKDDSTKREKTASLTSEDMTRIALDLGMSKHASADSVDGMLKLAGFEGGLSGVTMEKLASHEDVLNFFSSYIDSVNRENLEKLALEQEFDKHDPKQQAFGKLATIQKLSEFEKRIEGEIIRTSAKGVEEKMKAEVDADDAFTAALNAAKMRNFKELEDEQLDEISKKLLAISEEKRIPRFEILRSFFTVLATKGIHLTLTEFSHLTMHVLKGMAFEGDHDVFERKINDYRAHLTQMIMNDIRRQEITPGTGLFNVQNAIANQESPLGMHGLDKMIMALSGAAPFGMHAVVRRPMMKLASYQAGACSPAGIMGSDMTNEVIFTLETMVEKCPPLADRNKPIMSYATDLMEIAEMEKTAAAKRYFQNGRGEIFFTTGSGERERDWGFKEIKAPKDKSQVRHSTDLLDQDDGGGGPTTLQEEKEMFEGSDRSLAKWRSRGRKLALTGSALRFGPKYLVNSANAIQSENKKDLALKALRGSRKAGGYMIGAGLATSGMSTAMNEMAHKRYIRRLEQEQEKTATFAPAPIKPPTGIGEPMRAPKLPGIVKGGPNHPSNSENIMAAIALHKAGIRGGRWTTQTAANGEIDIRQEKTARAEEGKPKKKKDHSLRNAVLSGTVGGLGLAFGKLNRVIGEHEKNTADEWRLEGVLNSHLFNKDIQADDTVFETMADRSDKSARKFKRIGALSYGIGAAGAATSAYHLHNRYKKKKQADQEKTAGSNDYAELNRYFQKHPDKIQPTLSEGKDALIWAGTSAKNLKKKQADQLCHHRNGRKRY